MNFKPGDVLIDPAGEIYVVFGAPIMKVRGVFLERDTNTKGTFSGLIYRNVKYVAESFKKIGVL